MSETAIKPPVTNVGAIGWLRKNLFNSPFNTILTLLVIVSIYYTMVPFINWAFVDSIYRYDTPKEELVFSKDIDLSQEIDGNQFKKGLGEGVIVIENNSVEIEKEDNYQIIAKKIDGFDNIKAHMEKKADDDKTVYFLRVKDSKNPEEAPSIEFKNKSRACWTIIPKNIRFIFYGIYPIDESIVNTGIWKSTSGAIKTVMDFVLPKDFVDTTIFMLDEMLLGWRPLFAMILLCSMLLLSRNRNYWKKWFLILWVVALFAMGVLMKGGIFGLEDVESTKWSGLPLTLILAVFGMAAAYPLGVLLALGRKSEMVTIRTLCVVYIEMIRGVPLISLLFMSSIMFPLFLPEGVSVNKIIRAQAAIILFTAAYIAEVVRGGLQAIPNGQYEAAEALGLNYFQQMRLVILPQALKIVIPPTVGVLISAFKDTSLVVIIALYDFLMTTQTVLRDPDWLTFSVEAYIFISIIYFVLCYVMSSYSRKLESELERG
jgi:general L-amino acid transport system permease protein